MEFTRMSEKIQLHTSAPAAPALSQRTLSLCPCTLHACASAASACSLLSDPVAMCIAQRISRYMSNCMHPAVSAMFIACLHAAVSAMSILHARHCTSGIRYVHCSANSSLCPLPSEPLAMSILHAPSGIRYAHCLHAANDFAMSILHAFAPAAPAMFIAQRLRRYVHCPCSEPLAMSILHAPSGIRYAYCLHAADRFAMSIFMHLHHAAASAMFIAKRTRRYVRCPANLSLCLSCMHPAVSAMFTACSE